MIKQIYGKKLGMTQLFGEDGSLIGVTALEVEPVCILEKVQYPRKVRARIGCFKAQGKKEKKIKNPQAAYFKKLGVGLYSKIKEVEVENLEGLEEKKEIGIDIFEEGSLLDAQAKSKGRGFQGGMKRHNWRGQPRTHGSTTHRRLGSAGANTYPGRIIKGLRMPGHMGNAFVTVKNLKIVKIDKEKNTLFVRGAIPGPSGSIVLLTKVSK